MTDFDNKVWAVIRSYLNQYGVVRHQLESYDYFMTNLLPHIVQENSQFTIEGNDIKHSISLCNMSVLRPTVKECDRFERPVLPFVARLRGLTYCASVLVDLVHDIRENNGKTERRIYREILLAKIPVMLKTKYCNMSDQNNTSEECKMDQGGYFIINGVEKVLLAQEKLHTNRIYIFPVKQPAKALLVCEVRSCHEMKLRSTSTIYMYLNHPKDGVLPEIMCQLPFIDLQLPLYALFLLIGPQSKQEILDIVFHDNSAAQEEHMFSGILDSSIRVYKNRDEVIDWIGKEGTRELTRERRIRYLDHILSNELLPHLGLDRSEKANFLKSLFLGRMVKSLLRSYINPGKYPCDDRDDYANKRIDTSGMLMSLLFRQLYRNFLKSIHTMFHKLSEANKLQYTNIGDLINHKKISSGFKYAFSTGNWGLQKGKTTQTGVAQIMSRMTLVSALANLRRINTPINREGKAPKPRMLHHTSWGIVCPAETPEGGSCGLVKNLAILAHVRVGTPSSFLLYHLKNDPSVNFMLSDLTDDDRGATLLVNGYITSYVKQNKEYELLTTLREQRRSSKLPFDITISSSNNEIIIDSDAGCLCRPLFIVSKLDQFEKVYHSGDADSLWDRLLKNGIIEYLDKFEESEMKVAISQKDLCDSSYTHLEIHPSVINGLCAALIPFSDHNQAPRNVYQSAMCKQAVGVYALNYQRRMDTVAHVLCYPQRPLVSTRIDDILRTHEVPSGNNPIVCIMCYSGFNQEDSLIVNESALQRGMFRSVVYRTSKDEEKSTGADAEKFEKPDEISCAGIRAGQYDKLNSDGLVDPGTTVNQGDAIIGKTIATCELGEGRKVLKRDKSTIIKTEDAVVDAVLRSVNKEGHRFVKIRTKSFRQPVIGDKLSSRHGQKGVIGMVFPQEDMPYTKEGITPDIIVNPHAIPSRMTIGQLMECLLSKVSAQTMEIGDGTPFRGVSIECIADNLQTQGYQRYGNEKLYNGITGELMEGEVFLGPTYYQRLKHMVIDKEHARARGPVQILTRQPVEGRSREGGLRFGEMERDCIISHGAASVLRERLFEQSDAFTTAVCKTCGLLCIPKSSNTIVKGRDATCRQCKKSSETVNLRIPYAFKLLVQELMAMNIAPRLKIV